MSFQGGAPQSQPGQMAPGYGAPAPGGYHAPGQYGAAPGQPQAYGAPGAPMQHQQQQQQQQQPQPPPGFAPQIAPQQPAQGFPPQHQPAQMQAMPGAPPSMQSISAAGSQPQLNQLVRPSPIGAPTPAQPHALPPAAAPGSFAAMPGADGVCLLLLSVTDRPLRSL